MTMNRWASWYLWSSAATRSRNICPSVDLGGKGLKPAEHNIRHKSVEFTRLLLFSTACRTPQYSLQRCPSTTIVQGGARFENAVQIRAVGLAARRSCKALIYFRLHCREGRPLQQNHNSSAAITAGYSGGPATEERCLQRLLLLYIHTSPCRDVYNESLINSSRV